VKGVGWSFVLGSGRSSEGRSGLSLILAGLLPTELPDVQLREVDLDDVHSYSGVAELYNRDNEGVSMTALRPTYPHSKCPTVEVGKYGPGLLLMDENDELVGYFADPVGHNAEHT
jgi:hypothetical protein